METSPTITKISAALLKAQSKMGAAKKDSSNPFFKSKYADLNSVREACIPLLNENGITAIQPMVNKDGKNFINTILLHESGEFLSGLTEIVYKDQGNAQAQGSGITYARRYGLQSFVNIGSEDDDGNKASGQSSKTPATPQPTTTAGIKPPLTKDMPAFGRAQTAISTGEKTLADIEKVYTVSDEVAKLLTSKI